MPSARLGGEWRRALSHRQRTGDSRDDCDAYTGRCEEVRRRSRRNHSSCAIPRCRLIRYASAADAVPLAEFAARTFVETFAAHNRAEDVDEYVAKVYSAEQQACEISDPTIVTLLAEVEQLIGFA